jgi:hypothetical protein
MISVGRMGMLVLDDKSVYPRPLREKEHDLIEFVLPDDRPGYHHYCGLIASMVVLGEGRRGKGNLVLGTKGDTPDVSSPLAPVIAYGVVETTFDTFSVTVREYAGRQIDVEIVSTRGEEVPDHFEEKRRWTYSSWKPGDPSPSTGSPLREVVIVEHLILAIAQQEGRLWVYDGASGMNLLIPITNFYNELMLYKSIRDPNIALRSDLFFLNLGSYTDRELRAAFVSYNNLMHKVKLETQTLVEEPRGLRDLLTKLLKKKRA